MIHETITTSWYFKVKNHLFTIFWFRKSVQLHYLHVMSLWQVVLLILQMRCFSIIKTIAIIHYKKDSPDLETNLELTFLHLTLCLYTKHPNKDIQCQGGIPYRESPLSYYVITMNHHISKPSKTSQLSSALVSNS